MNPWGWYPPHLVDNTDTQYLGNQHWQQCWIFVFLFFLSICLSMRQSVCVSVDLFTINLKFLTTHSYWLAQLFYMSLVSGPEFKICKLRAENTHLIKLNQSITRKKAPPCFQKSFSKKNSSKKNKWETIVLGFGSKQPLQQQSILACFIGPVCLVVLWNVCFLPVQSFLCFSAWMWTTALEVYVLFFWIPTYG